MSATTKALLDLVLAKAGALREAGVLELTVDGLTLKLAAAKAPDEKPVQEEEPEADVWQDPSTYGRTDTVPGKHRKADR